MSVSSLWFLLRYCSMCAVAREDNEETGRDVPEGGEDEEGGRKNESKGSRKRWRKRARAEDRRKM